LKCGADGRIGDRSRKRLRPIDKGDRSGWGNSGRTAENSKTFASLVTLDINGKPTSFAANSATYGSGYFLLRLDVGDSGAVVSASTGFSSNCSKHITNCPTGTIALTSNGAPLARGSLALNSQGFAEDQSISPGNYSISAAYPGDFSYGPSSGTANFTIGKAPTTIIAGPLRLPVQYGNTQQIEGTVMTASDGVAHTGTFVFLVDGVQVAGPVPISQSIPYSPSISPPYAWAVASTATTFLSVGQHTLSAQYSGDSNYAAATGTDSIAVTPAVTVIELGCS